MNVFGVPLQMFLQAVDFFAQQRDLHIGRAGVFFVKLVFGDQFGFFFGGQHFFVIIFCGK
jgi:hypothetical protein